MSLSIKLPLAIIALCCIVLLHVDHVRSCNRTEMAKRRVERILRLHPDLMKTYPQLKNQICGRNEHETTDNSTIPTIPNDEERHIEPDDNENNNTDDNEEKKEGRRSWRI